MYNITSDVFETWQHTLPHTVNITFENGETELTITEADIVQNGMTIDRYTVSGNRVEIGSMIAAQLSLGIDNRDGRWANISFEGAQLYVTVSAGTSTIPLGYFVVDGAPRRLKQINLTALDRMMQFDRDVEYDANLRLPATPQTIVQWCCSRCNVPASGNIDFSSFPNYNVEIDEMPDSDDITYRQLLSWAGEMMGVCGWIDWEGHLMLGWYTPTGIEIDAMNRRNSDLFEAPVVLTGVNIKDADNVDHLYASDGYTLNIEGNELINIVGADTVGNALGEARQGFTYYPFVADVLPMPFAWPMDMMNYVTAEGSYPVILTNVTFSPNAFTAFEGKGESAMSAGYAQANPLTRRESAIIRALDKKTTEQLATRIQQVLDINDLASNSLGFFTDSEVLSDGSTISYSFNAPTIADSTLAFKKTGEGFFVSYDGGNSWTNGFSNDGTAVVNILSAIGIDAQWLNIADVVSRINGSDEQIDSSNVNINGDTLSSIYQSLSADIDALNSFMSSITQRADSIELSVQEVQEDVSNELNGYITEQGAHLEVTSEGVRVKTGATEELLLEGDDMSFQESEGGSVVAHYGADGMQTPEATVDGNLITGEYKWVTRAERMSLVYIGD